MCRVCCMRVCLSVSSRERSNDQQSRSQPDSRLGLDDGTGRDKSQQLTRTNPPSPDMVTHPLHLPTQALSKSRPEPRGRFVTYSIPRRIRLWSRIAMKSKYNAQFGIDNAAHVRAGAPPHPASPPQAAQISRSRRARTTNTLHTYPYLPVPHKCGQGQ